MNRELKKQEQLISSLERKYRAMLLYEQEERTKQLGGAKDEQNALINQLNSANSTITFIEQETQSKKVLIEELKLQIDNLETQLAKANADKKESVAEKESEKRSLNSYYKQTNDEFSNSHFQIQGLKDELLKIQEELEAKDSLVNELQASVKSLTLWNLGFMREYSVMAVEYNNLKLTADKKAASDAKLVREKEEELHQLKEKIEHALNEGSRKQVIIAELTQQREILKDSLENESKKTNDLMSELQITQENLGKTRKEAAEMEEHKSESHILHKELEVEVSKLEAVLSEVKESLQRKLEEELGMERENLESKANKLEEELASAKAEILHLRSEKISSSKFDTNDEGESKVFVNVEKKG